METASINIAGCEVVVIALPPEEGERERVFQFCVIHPSHDQDPWDYPLAEVRVPVPAPPADQEAPEQEPVPTGNEAAPDAAAHEDPAVALPGITRNLRPIGGLDGLARGWRAYRTGKADVQHVTAAEEGRRFNMDRLDRVAGLGGGIYCVLHHPTAGEFWTRSAALYYREVRLGTATGRDFRWRQDCISRTWATVAESQCYFLGAGLAFPAER
jgi:hypothetical protein